MIAGIGTGRQRNDIVAQRFDLAEKIGNLRIQFADIAVHILLEFIFQIRKFIAQRLFQIRNRLLETVDRFPLLRDGFALFGNGVLQCRHQFLQLLDPFAMQSQFRGGSQFHHIADVFKIVLRRIVFGGQRGKLFLQCGGVFTLFPRLFNGKLNSGNLIGKRIDRGLFFLLQLRQFLIRHHGIGQTVLQSLHPLLKRSLQSGNRLLQNHDPVAERILQGVAIKFQDHFEIFDLSSIGGVSSLNFCDDIVNRQLADRFQRLQLFFQFREFRLQFRMGIVSILPVSRIQCGEFVRIIGTVDRSLHDVALVLQFHQFRQKLGRALVRKLAKLTVDFQYQFLIGKIRFGDFGGQLLFQCRNPGIVEIGIFRIVGQLLLKFSDFIRITPVEIGNLISAFLFQQRLLRDQIRFRVAFQILNLTFDLFNPLFVFLQNHFQPFIECPGEIIQLRLKFGARFLVCDSHLFAQRLHIRLHSGFQLRIRIIGFLLQSGKPGIVIGLQLCNLAVVIFRQGIDLLLQIIGCFLRRFLEIGNLLFQIFLEVGDFRLIGIGEIRHLGSQSRCLRCQRLIQGIDPVLIILPLQIKRVVHGRFQRGKLVQRFPVRRSQIRLHGRHLLLQ